MADVRRLERECDVFTRYLTGRSAAAYVGGKYLDAFTGAQQSRLAACGRFDRLLLALARSHPLLTRVADIYSRFFSSGSVVRRRLVMLLALLESHAASIERLDSPTCGGLPGFVLGMGIRGTVSLLLLLTALPVLLPLQLLLGRCDRQYRAA